MSDPPPSPPQIIQCLDTKKIKYTVTIKTNKTAKTAVLKALLPRAAPVSKTSTNVGCTLPHTTFSTPTTKQPYFWLNRRPSYSRQLK